MLKKQTMQLKDNKGVVVRMPMPMSSQTGNFNIIGGKKPIRIDVYFLLMCNWRKSIIFNERQIYIAVFAIGNTFSKNRISFPIVLNLVSVCKT